MQRLGVIYKRTILISLSAMLVLMLPAAALADGLPAGGSSQTVQTAAVPDSVDRPTGSAAHTFVYNAASGLWENDYYTWNPTTHETLAKYISEYTYNSLTGLWDTSAWEYWPSTDSYNQATVSVAQPPAGAVTHGGPVTAPAAAAIQPAVSAAETKSAAAADTPAAAPSGTAATAAGATSPAPASDAPNTVINNVTGTSIHNTQTSAAQSGSALLQGNMNAGSAATGNAHAAATILNLLQSSSSLSGADVATFTRDITGDVNGDILIDPTALMQPAALSADDLNSLAINNEVNGSITNDITLSAASGDASLIDNYRAGDATTGNAAAMANVINLINSVVAANQSFVGVVNIYGNLVGDILVPQDTLNSLLASNGPASAASSPGQPAGDTSFSNTLNQEIENNVKLAATTGDVTLAGNTHAGDGHSGDALTRLTILNLTGHEVQAENSLLVFVNVLGTWVGVIMDAPAGTTAAALTGGAEPDENTASTTSGGSGPLPGSAQLAGTQTITNNISVTARSGDVAARDNFTVGDATSGDATASANIVNLMNSNFSLSRWFGVLFINVFGSWNGNFGAARPPAATPDGTNAGGTATAPNSGSGVGPANVRVFGFRPSSSSGAGTRTKLTRITPANFASAVQYEEYIEQITEVLADQNVVEQVEEYALPGPSDDSPHFSLAALPIALGITGLTAVSADRIRSARRKVVHYVARSLRS